jgi:hypothetical protein
MDYNNRSFTVTTLDKLVVSAFQGCRSASMPPNKRQNIVDKPGDRKLGYVIILLALLVADHRDQHYPFASLNWTHYILSLTFCKKILT